MPSVVLGLDIGGANLKAATADRRAVSVPFPLWKQPDKLPAALAGLAAKFPDAEEFAVTMTGELCDCYETKRQGVNAILTAVQNVSRSYPIRVWGTDGKFVNVEEARTDYLKVAAANWHALATFAGEYVAHGPALLLDIGSTTTDVIPLYDGEPVPEGKTDPDRLESLELLYVGVRRTPLCALLGVQCAAELFATTLDVYLMLGLHPDDPQDTDTADGRPATRTHAHARLSRMLCSDPELTSEEAASDLASRVEAKVLDSIRYNVRIVAGRVRDRDRQERGWMKARTVRVIASGSGEFAARRLLEPEGLADLNPSPIFLSDKLGPAVATCAPAYALAVLATERRP
ncbi:MAG TPA: hydantoinase/oxoprolinase family protein [Fimbriiglobus sp.]|nr:hydantoinase/oxoprolinase family protein [Fimbriiglobus sp.]